MSPSFTPPGQQPKERPVYVPKRRRPATASSAGPSSVRPAPPPRFHGAFTGGFSAGYFNTVGTKEGWTPRAAGTGTDGDGPATQQRPEDFMDEEDHAEWGGPTRVRDGYDASGGGMKAVGLGTALGTHGGTATQEENEDPASSSRGKGAQAPSSPLLEFGSILEVKHQTVGPRLMRRLGWREGGTAFVPDDATAGNLKGSGPASSSTGSGHEQGGDDADADADATLEGMTRIHLSTRRLRQIRLQTDRTKLPPPKLDQCGLGFDPYVDAPEFHRYREQRRQLARDRSSYGHHQRDNVYRLGDVAPNDDAAATTTATSGRRDVASAGPSRNADYLSYETAEDFVGKRSASGFALRDDDDDAYESSQHPALPRNDRDGSRTTAAALRAGEEYHTEVYEHETSSDDDNGGHGGGGRHATSAPRDRPAASGPPPTRTAKPADVGSLFASWAGTTADPSAAAAAAGPTTAALTSDGRPPLEGFVLGGFSDAHARKRYPGPDIPRDYQARRHVFGENERPHIFEAIARAVRLQREEEAEEQFRRQEQLQQQQQQRQPQSGLGPDAHGAHRGADRSGPLGGSGNFSSLASAMRNRFTSGTAGDDESNGRDVMSGLHMPDPVRKKTTEGGGESAAAADATRGGMAAPTAGQVTVTRTVQPFAPHPVVCKRFHVPVPEHGVAGGSRAVSGGRVDEATYFEREILPKAQARHKLRRPSAKDETTGTPGSSSPKRSTRSPPEERQDHEIIHPTGIERPSLTKLKTIFEPSSDESASSSGEEEEDANVDPDGAGDISISKRSAANDDAKKATSKEDASITGSDAMGLTVRGIEDGHSSSSPKRAQHPGEAATSQELVRFDPEDDDDARESSSELSSKDPKLRKRKKEDRLTKHGRKRHKRRRSRSPSTSSSDDLDQSSDDEDGEDPKRDNRKRRSKKERHHKAKKKRKKSSSSSSRRKK